MQANVSNGVIGSEWWTEYKSSFASKQVKSIKHADGRTSFHFLKRFQEMLIDNSNRGFEFGIKSKSSLREFSFWRVTSRKLVCDLTMSINFTFVVHRHVRRSINVAEDRMLQPTVRRCLMTCASWPRVGFRVNQTSSSMDFEFLNHFIVVDRLV